MSDELSAEDAKLVTLARGARGRVGSVTGAALRDETGRTYSAADVDLPSLKLWALQLAVAQAVASGSRGAETAVIVTSDFQAQHDSRALAELGDAATPLIVCDTAGNVVRRVTAGQGE